jgi:hypothetical protein
MRNLSFLTALALTAVHAPAQDGHRADALHWHVSDTWGFVAIVVTPAAALWVRRGR